jgi:hypothetical protein
MVDYTPSYTARNAGMVSNSSLSAAATLKVAELDRSFQEAGLNEFGILVIAQQAKTPDEVEKLLAALQAAQNLNCDGDTARDALRQRIADMDLVQHSLTEPIGKVEIAAIGATKA